MIVPKSIEMNKKSKYCIFDTNIFLLDFQINLIESIIYTTPSVIEEIKVDKYLKKNRMIISRIEAAIEMGKLNIRIPSDIYLEKVKLSSIDTGDLNSLSKADLDLIALALELNNEFQQEVILFTNDYSMENVCLQLNLPFSPFVKKGINSKIMWEVYCPFCNQIFESADLNSKCDRCGQNLKRRKKKSNKNLNS